MGTYNTLHGGKYCGQVKCLGKKMGAIVPGNSAHLYVFPAGERERELNSALPEGRISVEGSSYWLLVNGEKSEATSWQIRMDIGFAVFIDNVFVAWEDGPREGISIVSNHGRPSLDDAIDARYANDDGYGRGAGSCDVCALVRGARQPSSAA